MSESGTRRSFLAVAGASLLVSACTPKKKEEEEDVGAVEDLMREHGVIRRVLVIYRESAARLRTAPTSVPADALQKAAVLMRTFAEDYHEKLLEETHIFPAVKQAGGPAAAEIDTLLAQHHRGREITDWMLSVTKQAIGVASGEPLARALEGFARMYEEHAAREDTIVFPAWKKTLSKRALSELGEKFEDIEKKTFGGDGFDIAVAQVSTIEHAMGIDPGAFLPPAPRS